MASEMQQIVGLCQRRGSRRESIEGLEAELPLVLRLRRAWSFGDIWDLRKGHDFVAYLDSPVGVTSSKCDKFIDDSASTCDDGDASYISDESGMEDCSGLDWAEEMQASEAPKSWETPCSIWVVPSESFAIPPGQWTNTLRKLDGPPGVLSGPPGNMAAPKAPQSVVSVHGRNHGPARACSDLVESVKNVQRSDQQAWFWYTREYGENTRDPRKHTVQFLEDFLRQYDNGSIQGKMSAPPGKLAGLPENRS